jgi:hypothetical protein
MIKGKNVDTVSLPTLRTFIPKCPVVTNPEQDLLSSFAEKELLVQDTLDILKHRNIFKGCIARTMCYTNRAIQSAETVTDHLNVKPNAATPWMR